MSKKNVKYIQGFYFGYARYLIEDGQGDAVLLKIDYQNNKFKLVPRSEKINNPFRKEAERVARDLLGRKHGNNFVDRLFKRTE